MRLLLDTHVLLWALSGSKRLPHDARELIESAQNEVLFSAASIWEIAVKAQLLRAEFGVDVETIAAAARDTDFDELAISSRHAAGVAALPLRHKDPFDRMLMSQAIVEPARLVTADRALAAYSSDLVMLVESSR
jgi:PIN domain nuclease of toxin-antitoxin system